METEYREDGLERIIAQQFLLDSSTNMFLEAGLDEREGDGFFLYKAAGQ